MKQLAAVIFICTTISSFYLALNKEIFLKKSVNEKVSNALRNKFSVLKVDTTVGSLVGRKVERIENQKEDLQFLRLHKQVGLIEEKLKEFNFPHSTNHGHLTDQEKKKVIDLLVQKEELDQKLFQFEIKKRQGKLQ